MAVAFVAFAVASANAASSGGFPQGGPQYWPKFGGTREVVLLDSKSWEYGFIDS